MSTPNPVNLNNLDGRYARPADVASAIANQATTDAGQYLSKPTGGLSGQSLVKQVDGSVIWANPGSNTLGVSIPTTGDLVPVASYSGTFGTGTSNYGSDGLRSWKNRAITLLVDTPYIVLEYINWYSNGSIDVDGPAAMTLRVGMEKDASTILPVKWGGQDTIVVAPGGTVQSDPVFIDGKAGDVLYPRTTATMASGNTFVYTSVADVNFGYAYSPAQDNSRSGTNYAGGPSQAVSPVRILGYVQPGKVKRVVALVGDSIMEGANNDQDAFKSGFAMALDNQKVPYIKIAKGGESANGFASLKTASKRMTYIVGCTDAIVEYGTNDLGGYSLASIQASLITIWQRLVRTGITRVKQTTITPRTSSTDSFSTTTNQTPTSGAEVGGKRQQLNDWLRDGAPMLNGAAAAAGSSAAGTLRAGSPGHPLVGYIEVADTVESSRNSGAWKPNYTNDGIHPYGTASFNAIVSSIPDYTGSV